MSQLDFNQDLDKPLICQYDDNIDLCNSLLDMCGCFNRMVYEHNKPHNRVGEIILKGLPDKWAYKNTNTLVGLIYILLILPILNIIAIVAMIVFLCGIWSKYTETKKIVKKPWKNMLVIKDIPIQFSFATFTLNSLNSLPSNVLVGLSEKEKYEFHNLVNKNLLERPVVTVCSSPVIKNFKFGYKYIIILSCFAYILIGLIINLSAFVMIGAKLFPNFRL